MISRIFVLSSCLFIVYGWNNEFNLIFLFLSRLDETMQREGVTDLKLIFRHGWRAVESFSKKILWECFLLYFIPSVFRPWQNPQLCDISCPNHFGLCFHHRILEECEKRLQQWRGGIFSCEEKKEIREVKQNCQLNLLFLIPLYNPRRSPFLYLF